MSAKLYRPPADPLRRLKQYTTDQIVEFIQYHERAADRSMNALSCGSENSDYREANAAADAHWAAASVLRLVVKGKVENAV